MRCTMYVHFSWFMNISNRHHGICWIFSWNLCLQNLIETQLLLNSRGTIATKCLNDCVEPGVIRPNYLWVFWLRLETIWIAIDIETHNQYVQITTHSITFNHLNCLAQHFGVSSTSISMVFTQKLGYIPWVYVRVSVYSFQHVLNVFSILCILFLIKYQSLVWHGECLLRKLHEVRTRVNYDDILHHLRYLEFQLQFKFQEFKYENILIIRTCLIGVCWNHRNLVLENSIRNNGNEIHLYSVNYRHRRIIETTISNPC